MAAADLKSEIAFAATTGASASAGGGVDGSGRSSDGGWAINDQHSTHLNVIRLMNQLRPDENPSYALSFVRNIGGSAQFRMSDLPPDARIQKASELVRRWCRRANYGNTEPVRQLWIVLCDIGAVALYRSVRDDLLLRAVLTGESVYADCVLQLPDLTDAELRCTNALIETDEKSAAYDAAAGASTAVGSSRSADIKKESEPTHTISKAAAIADSPLLAAIRSDYLCRSFVPTDPNTGHEMPPAIPSVANRIAARTRLLNYQNRFGECALSAAILYVRPAVTHALLSRVPNIDLTLQNRTATPTADQLSLLYSESTHKPPIEGGVHEWVTAARLNASDSRNAEIDQIEDMIHESIGWYRVTLSASVASSLLLGDFALPKVIVHIINSYIV